MAPLTLEKKIAQLPESLRLKAESIIDALLDEAKSIAKKDPEQKNIIGGYGSMKGLIKYIADDFDAPLEDFKEYM